MLGLATIANFKANLRGPTIEPQDQDYDETRALYNAMIDKHPRRIGRCADVADVVKAVNFGRDNNQLIAFRGGGVRRASPPCLPAGTARLLMLSNKQSTFAPGG